MHHTHRQLYSQIILGQLKFFG
jgi:mannan endo-1,4-beta-mannosidase